MTDQNTCKTNTTSSSLSISGGDVWNNKLDISGRHDGHAMFGPKVQHSSNIFLLKGKTKKKV